MTEKFMIFFFQLCWYYWLLGHNQLVSCISKVDIVSEDIHALSFLIFALSRVDAWILLVSLFFFSRAPISILGKHELASMTLAYRMECGHDSVLQSLATIADQQRADGTCPPRIPILCCSGPFFQPFFLLPDVAVVLYAVGGGLDCRATSTLFKPFYLLPDVALSIWFSGPFYMQVSTVKHI